MKDISYWLDTALPYTTHSPLQEHITTDVVVIGGGITGVSAAYHSIMAGYKTVLIDKDLVASSSAGKNGGMVVEGLALDFHEAIAEFGLEKAIEAWQNTVISREYVAGLIEKHSIPCDFSRPGSLYFGSDATGLQNIEKELASRTTHGFLGGAMFTHDTSRKKALLVSSDCLLHPVKFVRNLTKVAEEHGLVIHEKTEAIAFDTHSVTTSQGSITAQKVIVAIESNKRDLTAHEGMVHREIGIVTEPLSEKDFESLGWHTGGMMWNTGHDYIAARKIDTRILLCRDIPMHPSENEMRETEEKLKTTFLQFFPGLPREKLATSHRWTGLLLYPERNRPFITNKNGYYELFGNGGNGLTNGIMLGKLVVDSFLGTDIPKIYKDSVI